MRYDRTFGGLRVVGGDFVSHRDASGVTRSVSWNASGRVAVPSTTPAVSAAAAAAKGHRDGLRESAPPTGELVVYAGGPAAVLAYDVLTTGVRGDQTPARLHTMVDAGSGAVITSWDEVENGTGNAIFVGSVPLGTTAVTGGYQMKDAAGNYTTDLRGATSGTGTTFTDTDDIWGNGSVSDRASAAVDAHYGAEKTFDYYKLVLGATGSGTTAGARGPGCTTATTTRTPSGTAPR